MALVSLRNLGKTYRSLHGAKYVAVENLSVDIEAGEFFCLLGTSGCGKTTVLNMLAGFEQPTQGRIEIDGHLVEGPGADRGVVFQGDDSLYEWLTARENIEFGLRMRGLKRSVRRERARHYLRLVGLEGQDNKHPSELSGGMKQRIQIARVLANEPQMLLMDEPFAALDAQTRLTMQAELLKIQASTHKSVLFITHDIDEAVTLADRIGVMHAGPVSRIKQIVEVDLGTEERERTNDRFLAIYKTVHAMIREEVGLALSRQDQAAR